MNNDLVYIIVGDNQNPIHNIFCTELRNNWGDINECAKVFDLNVPVKNLSLVNWVEFLESLPFEFLILHQHDQIFYDNVDSNMIRYYLETIRTNENISSIRLSRTGVSPSELVEYASGLYNIPENEIYPFSLTSSIWRKSALSELLKNCKPQFPDACDIFRIMKMVGLVAYHPGDTKRGMYHYENQFYPFMNTAMIDGKWNDMEYGIEIENLKREYSL